MELTDAIMTRRSVRQFTDEPIDDSIILEILESGRWAPSWANTQCWRFVVVRDSAQREKLAASLMKIQLPDRVVENPGAKAIRQSQVVIVVCAAMRVAGGKPGGNDGVFEYVTDKGDWFMFDTALAVQNMCLTVHNHGLGSVILGAFDAGIVEKVLEVPEGNRVVVMLPIGVPAKQSSAPPRKELKDIVLYEKWLS